MSSRQCSAKRPIDMQRTESGSSLRAIRCHLVTDEVVGHIKEGLQGCEAGIASFFIQHTSAALSINENYDSDVRKDMDSMVLLASKP